MIRSSENTRLRNSFKDKLSRINLKDDSIPLFKNEKDLVNHIETLIKELISELENKTRYRRY